MEEVTLTADTGRTTGTRPSRRLRGEGRIPGVLYGHGIDPVSLSVDGRALRAALSTEAGLNALVTLDVDGAKHLAMARQLQRDVRRGTVSHIDFVIVRRDEIVAADVPVTLVGEAAGLKDGAVLTQELSSLAVKAKPADIPGLIEVDVTSLEAGESIRVGDIALPSGVTTELDPEQPVATATIGRGTAAAEADADDEAAAEAGEAETDERDAATAEAEAGGDVDAGGDAASGDEAAAGGE